MVRDAIGSLKSAIALQTDAVFAALPHGATAASATDRLAVSMPSPSTGKRSDQQWRDLANGKAEQPMPGLYGGELTFSVSQPTPSLLLVQASFDIACGQDTVLLGYGNSGGAWKRLLLWQSKPYDQISGAFGDTYQTLLLKTRHNGNPMLLVVHGTPWCTSTMSVFRMDVLELGGNEPSQPLWHSDHDYRRSDLDPPLTLKSTANGFEIRTSVSGGGDTVSRKGIVRYAVTSAGIHRVEPLAINGRDTIVEWLGLPRDEAAEFADSPDASLTWQMFDAFTYRGKAQDATVPYPSFGAVRACKDSSAHFQAQVTSELLDSVARGGNQPGPVYFVQLREVPDGYRIHAVTRLPESSCSGPDIMAGS